MKKRAVRGKKRCPHCEKLVPTASKTCPSCQGTITTRGDVGRRRSRKDLVGNIGEAIQLANTLIQKSGGSDEAKGMIESVSKLIKLCGSENDALTVVHTLSE